MLSFSLFTWGAWHNSNRSIIQYEVFVLWCSSVSYIGKYVSSKYNAHYIWLKYFILPRFQVLCISSTMVFYMLYTQFKDILRYIRELVKILGRRVRIIRLNNLWTITSRLALYHCQFLIKIASFLFPHIQVHQRVEHSQVGNAEVYSDVEFVWMGHSHLLSLYWSHGVGMFDTSVQMVASRQRSKHIV